MFLEAEGSCLGYFMCARQAKRAAATQKLVPLAARPDHPPGSPDNVWIGSCSSVQLAARRIVCPL